MSVSGPIPGGGRGARAMATILLAALPVSAGGGEPQRVGLAGGPQTIWLYDHRPDPGSSQTLLRFAVRLDQRERFLFPAMLQGLTGRVHIAAALGDDLHVFFDEGTHRRYAIRQYQITAHSELSLPDRQRPLAIGGDPATRSLYAVVDPAVAGAMVQRAAENTVDPPADPPDTPGNAVGQAGGAPALTQPGHAILRYRAASWELVCFVPGWFTAQGACHVVIDEREAIHLLFERLEQGRSALTHAVYVDETWQPPRPVAADASARVLCGFAHDGGIVVISHSQADNGVQLNALRYVEPDWQRLGRLDPGEAFSAAAPAGVWAARFGASVGVAALQTNNELLFGRWPVNGGTALEQWQVIARPGAGAKNPWNWQSQSILAFVVLGLLLVYVFWRRQEVITRPLDLGPEFVIASYWRRAVGFLLDAAPIAMVTIWLWAPPMGRWLNDYGRLQLEGSQTPPLNNDVLVGWSAACAVYIFYCTVCEIIFATTPGKLAVQCRVVHEAGHDCSAGQIILRNLMRAVELFPLFQLWPTLILMLSTRNRQRLGDLLARTVVVQRQPPPVQTASDSDRDAQDQPPLN